MLRWRSISAVSRRRAAAALAAWPQHLDLRRLVQRQAGQACGTQALA
jgi:hypothetical protein